MPLSPALVKDQLGIRRRKNGMRATLRLTVGMKDLPWHSRIFVMIGFEVFWVDKQSRGAAFNLRRAKFKGSRIRFDDLRECCLQSLQKLRERVKAGVLAVIFYILFSTRGLTFLISAVATCLSCLWGATHTAVSGAFPVQSGSWPSRKHVLSSSELLIATS